MALSFRTPKLHLGAPDVVSMSSSEKEDFWFLDWLPNRGSLETSDRLLVESAAMVNTYLSYLSRGDFSVEDDFVRKPGRGISRADSGVSSRPRSDQAVSAAVQATSRAVDAMMAR